METKDKKCPCCRYDGDKLIKTCALCVAAGLQRCIDSAEAPSLADKIKAILLEVISKTKYADFRDFDADAAASAIVEMVERENKELKAALEKLVNWLAFQKPFLEAKELLEKL